MEIFVPQLLFKKYIDFNDQLTAGVDVGGQYELIQKRKGIIVQHLKFADNHNIVVDSGLKAFAASNDLGINTFLNFCHLGTGTSTPISTDTTLQAKGHTKFKTSSGLVYFAVNEYGLQIVWEYGLSDAVGTWTEVGAGLNDNTIVSRNLFRDFQGQPISVQKTSDDTLTIKYNLRFKRVSDTPFSSVVNVDGIGNITVESIISNYALSVLTDNGSLLNKTHNSALLGTNGRELDPSRNGTPSQVLGTPINTNASLNQAKAYVTNAFYRDLVYEWPVSVVGTIREACIYTWYNSYAPYPQVFIRFVEGIPKDDTKKLRLDFRVSYNRTS